MSKLLINCTDPRKLLINCDDPRKLLVGCVPSCEICVPGNAIVSTSSFTSCCTPPATMTFIACDERDNGNNYHRLRWIWNGTDSHGRNWELDVLYCFSTDTFCAILFCASTPGGYYRGNDCFCEISRKVVTGLSCSGGVLSGSFTIPGVNTNACNCSSDTASITI